MKIIDQGVVFAHRDKTDMSSCCFPSIAVLDTGRWLASARLAPGKSSRACRAGIVWSNDQGKTWTQPSATGPGALQAPPAINGHPGNWRAANLTPLGGSRVLATLCWEDFADPYVSMYNEKTEGLVDMKLFTTLSEDGGATWSVPRHIPLGKYNHLPNAITGPTLLLPDGRWAAQYEVNKPYDDTTPWQHHSSLAFSSDRGQTWNEVGDTHTDPEKRVFCWDQRVAVLGDGRVMALYWTFDRQTATYRNIHGRVSSDSGRTWSELYDTGVPGQPSRPVWLADGRIMMLIVDRSGTPTIKARLSTDGGRTWPADSEIIVHQPALRRQSREKGTMSDAWNEMAEFSLGLPDAVALADGTVLAVCYSGPDSGHTDIKWVRMSV